MTLGATCLFDRFKAACPGRFFRPGLAEARNTNLASRPGLMGHLAGPVA